MRPLALTHCWISGSRSSGHSPGSEASKSSLSTRRALAADGNGDRLMSARILHVQLVVRQGLDTSQAFLDATSGGRGILGIEVRPDFIGEALGHRGPPHDHQHLVPDPGLLQSLDRFTHGG